MTGRPDDDAPRLHEAPGRVHFVGVAGVGVGALAEYRARGGLPTSGSDRSLDRGEQPAVRAWLAEAGVALRPQDGSGVAGATLVVASTAVESRVADVARARELGVPVVTRAALLASHLAHGRTAAIAGSSGKSTVTAMTFEVLRAAGVDAGVITGGPLASLSARGLRGNAWRGEQALVAEADESDGSLVEHAPWCSTVLNVHRDHMDAERVFAQFETLARRTRGPRVVSDDPALAPLREGALVFGFGADAALRGRELREAGWGSSFVVDDVRVEVPLPGAHNAFDALAAIATARAFDVDVATCAAALSSFAGVERRFQRVGEARGVVVVDDYAHNPAKVEAALRAARPLGTRVIAFFQPHGFGPLRFMREELVERIAAAAGPDDLVRFGPVYYAGGTVTRDVSSEDVAADLRARGVDATAPTSREEWLDELSGEAESGDVVLVLGARDPSLSTFARHVLAAVGR